MNNISLIGRITAEPELRTTTAGVPVCSFFLAVPRPRTKDKTDFISCSAWRQQAELIVRYLHKGDQLGISGTLVTRERSVGENAKVKEYAVDITDITFCGSTRREVGESNTAEADPAGASFEELGRDDDLPF